jgi:hypothetical protein
MIIAKFKVQRVECSQIQRQKAGAKGYGKEDMETLEQRTLVLSPVYANGDPNHENSKFWNATPTGEIRLGVVNPEAWTQFDLGAEYYVRFDKAPEEVTGPPSTTAL